MSFPGTEHYRSVAKRRKERVEELGKKGWISLDELDLSLSTIDVSELCDHIEDQRKHIEALDEALRTSGERRAAVERQAEERGKEIERLREETEKLQKHVDSLTCAWNASQNTITELRVMLQRRLTYLVEQLAFMRKKYPELIPDAGLTEEQLAEEVRQALEKVSPRTESSEEKP